MSLRCEKCGQFISHKKYVTYIEHGTDVAASTEFSPRDPVFLCLKCYEKLDKALLDSVAWVKPMIVELR